MKKTKIMFLALAAIVMAACSNNDEIAELPKQPAEQGLVVRATMPSVYDEETRTDIIPGNSTDSELMIWNDIYVVDNHRWVKEKEYILAYILDYRQIYYHRFESVISGPARTTEFKEVVAPSGESLKDEILAAIKAGNQVSQVVFAKVTYESSLKEEPGIGNYDDKKIVTHNDGFTIGKDEFLSTYKDFLISEPIDVNKITAENSEPLDIKFQRLNAIMKINLKFKKGGTINPKAEDAILSNIYIYSDNESEGLGILEFDIKQRKVTYAYTSEINIEGIEDNLFIGHENPEADDEYYVYTFYIGVNPMLLKTGQAIRFEPFINRDYKIKTFTAPYDIQFEAGKIYTFNLIYD